MDQWGTLHSWGQRKLFDQCPFLQGPPSQQTHAASSSSSSVQNPGHWPVKKTIRFKNRTDDMYSKRRNAELVICRRHIFQGLNAEMVSITRHVHRISMQSWWFVHLQHLNVELVIYTRYVHGIWMQNWWLVQDIFTALECRIKDLYETYYLQDLNAELVTCTGSKFLQIL